jgi:hypothetical protein
MGIYGKSYNHLLWKSWTSINTIDGFKSVLPVNDDENSPGHYNRLNKFGANLIKEREILYDVIQRNGRAKSQNAQTGQ